MGGSEQSTAEEAETVDSEAPRPLAGASEAISEKYTVVVDSFVRGTELAAATVFAALFAIGVIDLTLQIFDAVRSGTITDPLVVISFIDTGLLLLIIVEVYQTVLAYVEESETRRIVRLVIYTGVIAMVRKAIIFRTGEYDTLADAMLAASSYTVIIFALVALLFAERVYGNTDDGNLM